MPTDRERIEELEREVEKLKLDVERYRTAAEDSLQQIDWCIGFFTGVNKGKIAQHLAANRNYIRKTHLRREDAGVPTTAEAS